MYKYVLVFITALVPLQLSAAQQPTAAELLEKYTQNREKLKSFTLKYEEEVHGDGRKFLANYRTLGKRNIYKGGYFGKIRSDGDRHYQSEKFWDENMPLRAHSKSEAEASPIYTSHLWDGKKHYQYMFSSKGAEKDWLIIDDGREPSKINFTISDIVIRTSRDHILRGGFHNSQQRGPLKLIDEELKEVDSIFVQKDTEEINGSQCYVIKAKSKDSEYKIWIDPEHGYNIAKARIFRGGEGVEYGNENEISLLTYLRDVRFEKIEGIWVPMEADYGLHIKRAKGSYLKTNHHIKRTEFVLNPDHDALGSFDIDYVRNGARTVILGVKGIKYRWQDGELIPNIDKLVIAELDRMAAEVAAEREGSDVNNLAVAEISIPDGNDVFIPDANAALKGGNPFIFDFVAAKLIYADGLDNEKAHKYLSLLGKGDIGWNGSVVAVRDAVILPIKSSAQKPMVLAESQWCRFYKLPDKAKLPYTFIVSRGEQNYIMQIKEITKNGIKVTYAKIDNEYAKTLAEPDANDSDSKRQP